MEVQELNTSLNVAKEVVDEMESLIDILTTEVEELHTTCDVVLAKDCCQVKEKLYPRRACAASVIRVCLCVSVKSHLTYGASVRPENAVTYSAGTEGQNIVGFSLKPLRCRDLALPPCTAMRTVGHFSCGNHACAL